MSGTGWRPWLPDGIAALGVLAIAQTEAYRAWALTGGRRAGFVLALGVAVAVGLCRHAPGAALAVVWAIGLFHLVRGAPIMLSEFALTAVFYGGARWGRSATTV